MPFIHCHIKPGLSESRKRQLMREIIAVTQEAIDDDPKLTNVVLHEHPGVNMSVSGRIEGDVEGADAA
jgi:phenylpyruvate tautomerase PptA (4-oxalocrotonate tautomerase family)